MGAALVAVAWLAAGPGAVTRAAAVTNCDTAEAGITPEEQAFLTLLNQERARQSPAAPALKLSPNLNRAAAWKAVDSLVKWDHIDSLGRSPKTRAAQCGYAAGMGENLANGFASAQSVFTAWMGSAGHKSNMLNPAYTVAGVGQHGGSWTLDLGSFDDSGQGAPPAQATPMPTSVPPAAAAAPTIQSPPVPVQGISMALGAGFNLVTYAGSEQVAGVGLGRLGTQLSAAYEWDAPGERWLRYFPGAPAYVNTLTTLLPGHAYYLVVAAATVWAY